MIILTTAHNYDAGVVKPFFNSLKASGYSGRLAVMGNNCGAVKWLKERGAKILPDPGGRYHINSRRFLAYKEYLRGVDEPAIISDVRDVIFQKNPEEFMPTEGVNVYQEHGEKLIEDCPYNSKWMKTIFGGEVKWGDRPIICAGVTSGRLMEYCVALWEAILAAPIEVGLDQALHTHMAYSGRVKATIWPNEAGEVYTVGYIPRESVRMVNGEVINQSGAVPCIVHQYDRHQNLTKGYMRWR